MSASTAPVHKTGEEKVAEAIIAGDLNTVKTLKLSRIDVNRRLLAMRDLVYQPKRNPTERYLSLRGPTPIILAILCEQDEILEYFLESKGPDLSITVVGHTALHVAALVKDWRPMQLLLRYEYIQANIDAPIDTRGTPAREGEFTTALHVAVANRRYHQIFLLLTPFPPYKKLPGATAPAPELKEPTVKYEVARVNQRSSTGSTPLFIATFNKDAAAVEILLAAGADPAIPNDKGVFPLGLAQANQAKEEAQLKGRRGPAESARIVELLQSKSSVADLETLRKKYARELTGEGGEEEEAGDRRSRVERVLDEILDAIDELKSRVTRVEATIARLVAEAPVAAPSGNVELGGAEED